jgi:hypothetical protein
VVQLGRKEDDGLWPRARRDVGSLMAPLLAAEYIIQYRDVSNIRSDFN